MAAAVRQPLFHPLVRARLFVWRKRARDWSFYVMATLVVASVLRWVWPARWFARAAEAPLVPAVVLFALTYLCARAYVGRIEADMRTGWFAALPIGRAARTRTALLATIVAAVAVRIPVELAFLASPRQGFDLASVAAALAAFIATREFRRTRPDERNPALRQVPSLFFANATPRTRAFPHLAHWQRLRTTAYWRTTGRAWQLGLVALALPRNAAIVVLPVLVTIVALLWWSVMARAVSSVYVDARALLAAIDFDRARLVRDASTYPAIATALTVAVLAGVAVAT